MFLVRCSLIPASGFSLIEVVVAMGIAAIVFLMVGVLGNQFSIVSNFVNQKLQNEGRAQSALQTMVREIRSAGPPAIGGLLV